MRPHRQRVEQSVSEGGTPRFEPPAWQSYKAYFARTQHGKCAYCEVHVLATGVGDVEHFRPKAEVTELLDDPNTWGREVPGLANVVGRQTPKVSKSGYWWLAYSWENWLLACERCNVAWKRSLFPVAESPRQPPKRGVDETPLLLDPYGVENPSAHLRFDVAGQVEPFRGSQMGFETIRTLGLDRTHLRASREEIALRAHALVRKLKVAEQDELDETLDDILRIGSRKSLHAGMVRVVFEQLTGDDWSLLEET